jgi:hypothetical protein
VVARQGCSKASDSAEASDRIDSCCSRGGIPTFKCNPPGADLLFEDYQAFHESLKAGESVKVVTKDDAIAQALVAIAEFANGEERDFDTKAANAIRAIRFLMQMKTRARG